MSTKRERNWTEILSAWTPKSMLWDLHCFPPQCILYQDMHLIIHSCGCSLCFSILGLFCDASGKITRCIGYQLLATFRTLLHFLWSSWLAMHVCVVTTQTNAAQLIRKIKDYNERKKSTIFFFLSDLILQLCYFK